MATRLTDLPRAGELEEGVGFDLSATDIANMTPWFLHLDVPAIKVVARPV